MAEDQSIGNSGDPGIEGMPGCFWRCRLNGILAQKAVVAAFKRQPLHAILPWLRFETREAFGKDSRGELDNQSRN